MFELLSEEKQFRSLTLSGEGFLVTEIGLCRGLLAGCSFATEAGRGVGVEFGELW